MYKLTKNKIFLCKVDENLFFQKIIDHPEYQKYLKWVEEGGITEIEGLDTQDYINAAQIYMDDYARDWGYDNIDNAVTYVGDSFDLFNQEGIILKNWRSEVWRFFEDNTSDQFPATIENFLKLLPSKPDKA